MRKPPSPLSMVLKRSRLHSLHSSVPVSVNFESYTSAPPSGFQDLIRKVRFGGRGGGLKRKLGRDEVSCQDCKEVMDSGVGNGAGGSPVWSQESQEGPKKANCPYYVAQEWILWGKNTAGAQLLDASQWPGPNPSPEPCCLRGLAPPPLLAPTSIIHAPSPQNPPPTLAFPHHTRPISSPSSLLHPGLGWGASFLPLPNL